MQFSLDSDSSIHKESISPKRQQHECLSCRPETLPKSPPDSAIFSRIYTQNSLDPRWQTEQLATLPLPFPIVLSWDRSRHVERITCHKVLKLTLGAVFQAILKAGLQSKISSFGGCFSFRPQRSGKKLSTHSWGIAIDLNPESNAQGTTGDMDPSIVAIFTQAGFAWGGDWQGTVRDPMHFQFCTGY